MIGFFLDLFAQLVLVDLPLGGLLKHTEMLFLGFLLRTLAAALVVLLYWMALVLFFPYTLPLLLITGGWLPGVLAVQILYPALDQAYGLTQRDADIEQESGEVCNGEQEYVPAAETEEFMRGELDNVTVAESRILLDVVQGGHVPYGCYTSPAIRCPRLTRCG